MKTIRSYVSPMGSTSLRLVILAIVLLTAVKPASATIVSGFVSGGSALAAGGKFIKLPVPLPNPLGPPNSVGNDTFQTPNLYGFDEDQNILLAAALNTDVGLDPIPAGTFVASHYIFFDPGPTQSMQGFVNFDADVIAIITATGTLFASDFLANTGVNYLNPAARGLEAGDAVTISGLQQIFFDTTASTPGDYVRVLTKFSPGAVPEPSTYVLLVTGLIGLGYARRRAR